MAKVYYDADANLDLLKGKTIAIIGYGSQGHAHALNLKDSGCRVVVGLRPDGKSWSEASAAGLKVLDIPEAARAGDIVSLLLPDQYHAQVYKECILQGLSKGKALLFGHGFNIHYNQITPPPDIDVIMVAPKSPGHMMRNMFVQGVGVPSLLAIHQDATGKARDIALAYARGIGSTSAGVIETTFAEETETDLFGEQTVLCGGVTALIKAAFEIMVESGYQPEVAYFECLHELKLIVDLIYEGGMGRMRFSVSDTAEYGDYTRGPRVIDDLVREEMYEILDEIQDGRFAKEWILENQAGRPHFLALRRQEAEHPIEEVGRGLRSMMKWLKK